MAASSMNPVVHFEMPAEDRTRMRNFYESTFGWKTEQLGPEMRDYVLVQTTETDKNHRPKTPGSINGGFYPKREDWPAQYPSVVVAVDDIKASMKKVEAAGGKVLGEPMDIPGYGLHVSFFDTEGNRVSMMQPLEMRKGKAKQPQVGDHRNLTEPPGARGLELTRPPLAGTCRRARTHGGLGRA